MTLSKTDNILVVDDDHALCMMLIEYLSRHGLHADGAETVAQAQQAVANKRYDLVLLDLDLPDGDGVDLARSWRAEMPISIIFLTGRNEEADLVMGLELVADDYVVKPFSMREVLARMRAVMRRAATATQVPVTRGKHPRSYRFAGWSLNLNTRRLLSPDNIQVPLTNAEFNLLTVFLAAPVGIISRERLLERSRAFDDVYDRAIDVQILRLRRKLESDPKNPKLLCTERGAGYFFNAEIETTWE
ncbi:MAG: response regulator [Herbaspirillum sp.]